MRTRNETILRPRRAVAALGLVALVAFGCGTTGPTPSASPGASLPTTATPSGSPVVVGAAGGGAANPAAPVPLPRVDFEVKGDENNGWWWLRDAGGAQHASWGLKQGGQNP